MNISRFRAAAFALVVAALPSSFPLQGQASGREPVDLWSEVHPSGRIEANAAARSVALFRVDLPELARHLDLAPLETDGGAGKALALALPAWDGSRHRFAFVRTPILSEASAAEFPDLRTFRGRGLDHPEELADLVIGDSGVSGMILAHGQATYLDSDRDDLGLVRMTRFVPGSKLTAAADDAPFFCSTPRSPSIEHSQTEEISEASERREIRVALSATPSFYLSLIDPQLGIPTRNHAAALMTSLLSQASMIYEQQLGIALYRSSIKLGLPECRHPGDLGTCQLELMDSNQIYLDDESVLGSARYDLGHVFSRPRGDASAGRAEVAVCGSSIKAKGVTTGAPGDPDASGWDPTRDRFFHAFVHELGHQMGAQHTFTGSVGACGEYVYPDTAYEPLGGSTIMSYAGRCSAPDILQAFPDLYLHANSLEAIRNHVSPAIGEGCGRGLSPIIPPQFEPVGTSEITIPKGMAFALEKRATGGPVAYTWEQLDAGSPLFRSFPAEGAERRTFPKDPSHPKAGETLPGGEGTMTFRVTARNGGGGFAFSDVAVHVDAAGPFQIVSPSPLGRWLSGTQRTVQWTFSGASSDSTLRCDPPTISLEIPGRAPMPLPVVQMLSDGARVQLPSGLPNGTADLVVECGSYREFFARSSSFQLVTGVPSQSPIARFEVSTLISTFPQIQVLFDPGTTSPDPLHLADTYLWTVGVEQTALSTPAPFVHIFTAPGRYPVRLELLNDGESISSHADTVVIPSGNLAIASASGTFTLGVRGTTTFCHSSPGTTAKCNFPANACGRVALVVSCDAASGSSAPYHLSLGGGATFSNGSTEKDSALAPVLWDAFAVDVPCP